MYQKPTFRNQLQHLINCHSKENGSDTPDYVLAEYLVACLKAFDNAVILRERHAGRDAGSEKAPLSQIEGDKQ